MNTTITPEKTATPARNPATAAAATVQPYLFFEGRTEEAIEFYRRAVGLEVELLMRYRDAPPAPAGSGCGGIKPGTENKIMHATLRVGASTFCAADGHCSGETKFEGFALSYTAPTPAEAERAFTALSKGGTVLQPLMETFFSQRFGMLKDPFGVMWSVLVTPRV